MNNRRPLLSRVAAFVAIFATTILFSAAAAHADPPAPAAPPAQQPAAPGAKTEVPAPKARREDVEPSTLQEAKTLLTTARAERDKAETDLGTETASHDKTKGILATTIETARSAVAERDTAKTNLATVTRERDDEKAAHGKTKEQLNLAEGALQVKGISTKEAPAAVADPGAKSSVADWDAKIKAAKTPAEQAAISKEFEKAFADGLIA